MILEHKKIESLDDYFLELSKRREKGVFFYRINGISDEIEKLVSDKLLIPSYPADEATSESLNVAVATAIVCSEFRRRGC